jgi:hypothetical protein
MATLTSRDLAQSTAITPTTLIHIVTTADTSQSIYGSSYKAELQQLSSIFSGGSSSFTGGTVTGPTIFTNGLTADTISATTYYNLPVSGLTEGSNISITGNNGNFTISVTGITNGEFTGGTVTGSTTFTNGLSANTISATSITINGVSITGDTFVTGGTYTNGDINFNYNTGGGFVVTGITSINPFYGAGSGSTINWDVSGVSTNYEITLTASTTLNLTNVRNGEYGTLIINQPSVGSYNISLGTVNGAAANHRVVNGAGGILLTSTSNAIDIISFTYNGTKMFWTVGNDYV